jgi:hypothetical protein
MQPATCGAREIIGIGVQASDIAGIQNAKCNVNVNVNVNVINGNSSDYDKIIEPIVATRSRGSDRCP